MSRTSSRTYRTRRNEEAEKSPILVLDCATLRRHSSIAPPKTTFLILHRGPSKTTPHTNAASGRCPSLNTDTQRIYEDCLRLRASRVLFRTMHVRQCFRAGGRSRIRTHGDKSRALKTHSTYKCQPLLLDLRRTFHDDSRPCKWRIDTSTGHRFAEEDMSSRDEKHHYHAGCRKFGVILRDESHRKQVIWSYFRAVLAIGKRSRSKLSRSTKTPRPVLQTSQGGLLQPSPRPTETPAHLYMKVRLEEDTSAKSVEAQSAAAPKRDVSWKALCGVVDEAQTEIFLPDTSVGP
ncbi:hypothetical protein DXG01_014287 [Tephrocybe rancida]|nr:hypothetical protein DXG01_014287 [Tephrocybe rancida]